MNLCEAVAAESAVRWKQAASSARDQVRLLWRLLRISTASYFVLVGDYRPLLALAGFETLSYDQIPNWQDHVSAGFGAVVAEREALEAELGAAAAAATVLEASITLELQPYRGHVLAVAVRI